MIQGKRLTLLALLIALALLTAAVYAASSVLPFGGTWQASGDDDCVGSKVCAEWDMSKVTTEPVVGPICCIDSTGINTGDPGACQAKFRHSH